MQVNALGIFIGGTTPEHRIGVLFRYELSKDMVTQRFVADEAFAKRADAPVVSASLLAANPDEQRRLWQDYKSTLLNGRHSGANGWVLPSFFQNLLPEGVFRAHVAELRGCGPKDHFELLAACGNDLPGNVYALPVDLSRDELQFYVTQNQDALEMSVTAEPMQQGVSLSGVQPKLAVRKEDGRYVARTRLGDTYLIAKLPVVGFPFLPELEALSLELAHAAGVNICEAELVPLSELEAEHGYDLGETSHTTKFLAVHRYDRNQPGRAHCEDFCQVLGVWPEDKYSKGDYLQVAAILLGLFGEAGVHELLRRLLVNEMLGNSDMHLKNIGLKYGDGQTPELPGAYDIVGYAAYSPHKGHALPLIPRQQGEPAKPRVRANAAPVVTAHDQLTPLVLRKFCAMLGIPEKPAQAVLRRCAQAAVDAWPALIENASITPQMKANLTKHFEGHTAVAGLRAREARRKAQ
jgi:serine/threonine-protein kinase HipA